MKRRYLVKYIDGGSEYVDADFGEVTEHWVIFFEDHEHRVLVKAVRTVHVESLTLVHDDIPDDLIQQLLRKSDATG